MSLFLSALIGDPIGLIPMNEVINKVRMLLGSSDDGDEDGDDKPEWKKKGHCCENMKIIAGIKDDWTGKYVYHYCENCGKNAGTAFK